MRTRTNLILLLVIVIIGAAWLFLQSPTSSPTIKIGVLAPLTGPLATITENARQGLELARAEINAQGGINGQPIALLYEDIDICYPKKAVDAVKKFLGADQLKVIFSLVCGGNQVIATHEITEPAKVIHFSSSATISKISNLGRYIFRNMAKNDFEMEYLAQYLRQKFGYQTLFSISIQTEWGQSYLDASTKAWQQAGGKVLGTAEVDQNERDYRTVLLQAKKSGADVLFLNVVNGQPIALALQQAAELGISQQIITGYNNITPNTLEIAKNAAESVLFPYPVTANTPTAKVFQEKYRQQYGQESEIHAANSYDMLQLTAAALRQCGQDTDCMADYLYAVKDYDGVSGLTTFDANGDVNKPFTMWTVKNGKRTPLSPVDK